MLRAVSASSVVLARTSSNSQLNTCHNASTLQENKAYYCYYTKTEFYKPVYMSSYNSPHLYLQGV